MGGEREGKGREEGEGLHAPQCGILATPLVRIHYTVGQKNCTIFTALHVCRRGIARRILSVCLSVRLSVTRVIPDKTEERSVQIFIPYERIFILVF